MIDATAIAPERFRPLFRDEYDRLVELGVFGDERIELLKGALVEMSPQGTRHAEAVSRLTKIFVRGVGDRAEVRVQSPLAAADDSEPEPDLALLPPGDYSRSHPDRALLVVEVADSSLRKDREIKADLYAEADVPEYWLVDLVAGAVEVRTAPRGGRYTRLDTLTEGTLRPQAFPEIPVQVAKLLP